MVEILTDLKCNASIIDIGSKSYQMQPQRYIYPILYYLHESYYHFKELGQNQFVR